MGSDVGDDVCDYPLARNLVMLTASVAWETIIRQLVEDEPRSWSITLRDLNVKMVEN